MRNKITFAMLVMVFMTAGMLMPRQAGAQEWSAAQKEVWKGVNDYWAVMTKGDIAGFMDYFHPEYLGWEDSSPLPSNKAETQKWLQLMTQGSKVLIYEIKPVGIRVFGDFAYVHYYYTMVAEKDGKKKTEEGRWTDILLKQGGKWLLIGDNGGETSKKSAE